MIIVTKKGDRAVKKAIFFDIDGTLIEAKDGIKEIRPNVQSAIRSLQENGHYVFIATGRPYAFLSQAILNFGFDGFILANGAHVVVKDELLHSEPLDKEFVKEFTSKLEAMNVQYILEGEKQSYLKETHKEFYEFYDRVGILNDLFESNYSLDEVDIHKIEMLCMTDEIYQACLELLAGHDEYDHVSSIDFGVCELYSKKNTKATGIIKALQHLNIPIENSYAFGDGKNDIEMLSTVGCGIAMGNASDEVKKYAHQVTETVHNDGAAFGIEKFVV